MPVLDRQVFYYTQLLHLSEIALPVLQLGALASSGASAYLGLRHMHGGSGSCLCSLVRILADQRDCPER